MSCSRQYRCAAWGWSLVFNMPRSRVVESEDLWTTNIARGEITNFTLPLLIVSPETTSPDPVNKILVIIHGINAFSTRLQSLHASLLVIILPCVAYVLVCIRLFFPFSFHPPRELKKLATLFLWMRTSFFNAKLASREPT